MPEQLRSTAYYYGFRMTGVREVDQILSAIVMAGKAFHGTSQWDEGIFDEQLSLGGDITPVDLIQEMADRAAKSFKEKT